MHILVFDSGLGGLTVLREIRKALPHASITYLADDAVFPYGRLAEDVLVARVMEVIAGEVARRSPDVIVIACNTAATVVLPPLRARYSIPIVGTVPAIKPAAETSASGMFSVLATPGTVARDYTRALLDEFALGCAVTLVGCPHLAALAESRLKGSRVADTDIFSEIQAAFVEHNGQRTDTIVLACTHYPLLLDELERLAPWSVTWIDPAPAIARRVVQLIGTMPRNEETVGSGRAVFTSGQALPPSILDHLRVLGLSL